MKLVVQYEESIDAYTPHDVEMVKKPGETFGFHLWFDDQGSSQKFTISKFNHSCFESFFENYEIKSKFIKISLTSLVFRTLSV